MLENFMLKNVGENFFITYCKKKLFKWQKLGNYNKKLGKVGYEGIEFGGYKPFTHATGEYIHEDFQ